MKYDYIITGAGCAGLSLAFYLSKTDLGDKKILLIDKTDKQDNDRTWCFWQSETSVFESIVHHKWDNLYFKSPSGEQLLDIAPYQYKMIRGIDFYNFILKTLRQHPNFTIKKARVTGISNEKNHAKVRTQRETFEARYVFNSILFEKINTENSNYVAQHFGGWIIETNDVVFNPNEATLMDFRIPQESETRFMYCLPMSKNTALVEATAFSNNILTEAEYGKMITDYLNNYLNINNFTIQHKEIGVIPMTTYNFAQHHKPHVIQIGTMGGNVKPSTGYAFVRIQENAQKIASALKNNQSPHLKTSLFQKRFLYYDNILLNVMLKDRVPTHQVFSQLFQKNKASTVLKFLNEKTNFLQELAVMNSVPIPPFIVAAFDEMRPRRG